MAEKENAKKKPRKIRLILEWIGVACLALLVLAAVYLRAPWKLIALLLIFLSACTILPKPARKWFWAGVGVVIIALIIWVFLPEDNEGWRPYTFDEELAALQAKYAIPDQENAATIYNQLLADHDARYKQREQKEGDKLIAEVLEEGTAHIPVEDVNDTNNLFGFSYTTFYPDFWNSDIDYLTRTQKWSSKDYPKPAQWLRERQDTTKMLLEASRKQRCSFPISPDAMSLGLSLERYGPMRRCATFLIQASNNDLGDGRVDAALEKNSAVLQMANHQYQQPTVMDFLVAQTFEIHALENLKRVVIEEKLASEHLDLIQEALAKIKYDWRADFLRILESEKLIAKNTHARLLFEINQRGKIRRNRTPEAIVLSQDANHISEPTFCQKKLHKARIALGWFFSPSTPEDLTEILDSAYESLSAMAEDNFDWQEKPQKISLSSIEFNYRFLLRLCIVIGQRSMHKFHEQYLRAAADRAGTMLIVQLSRYKNKTASWPESLDMIKDSVEPQYFVDPANGGSFVYKLRQDTFILYSRGINNIDERGKRWSDDDGTRVDDWLIWPSERRLHEMNEEHAQEPPS